MTKKFGNPFQRNTPSKVSNDNHDGDDDDGNSRKPSLVEFPWSNVTAMALPQITRMAMRTLFGITLALYVLNQKHCLPRPLSAVVSQTLFWPTLPITITRRLGKWVSKVDDTVIIGGAPFGFLDYPQKLYDEYGVRGVINLCEEYRGPLRKYKELGMEELYLPTTDHFEPTVDDMLSAIAFVKRHQAQGKKVYVHCRAGHGRSAAIVFGWLIYKDPIVDLASLNSNFCKLRNVRSSLWKQPNIRKLHDRLKKTGTVLDTSDFLSSYERPPKLVNDVSEEEDEDL